MEIVELGRKIEAIERPEAAKRKTAGANQHTEPSGNFPEGSKGQTRDKVGEALGVSGKTYEKLKAVKENGVQELIDAVDAGDVSADAAAKLVKLPKEIVMPTPITTVEQCADRLVALGHSFGIRPDGSITVSHPLAPPNAAEMDEVAKYLSGNWDAVMNAIRRRLLAEGPNLGSPAPAKSARAG